AVRNAFHGCERDRWIDGDVSDVKRLHGASGNKVRYGGLCVKCTPRGSSRMRLLIGPIFSIRTVAIVLCLSIAAVAWADSPSSPPVVLSAADSANLKGNAGGSIRATQYGVSKTGPCMGWIPTEPQHTLVLTARALTNIAVHSTADTTLIVVGEVDGKRVVRF